MAEMSEDVKKALEEQKANCPFCKIIKGEIPSKKVYEDDKVVAVLDINPAVKGHVLVMPKEHYPILPYVPYEEFKHLFEITQDISRCLKKSLARTGANIFIANGWVAGQQSQHFMLHIIPREDNDGIFLFNMKGEGEDKEKIGDAFKILSNNLPIMMNNHFKQHPADWHTASKVAGEVMRKFTKEQVIDIIEKNPNLKEWIIKDPDSLISQIDSNDQLKGLFADVDVMDIIKHFNKDYKPKKKKAKKEKEKPEEKEEDVMKELQGEEESDEEDSDEDVEEEGDEEADEETEGEEPEEEVEEETEEESDEETEEEKEGADLDDISTLFK